MSVNNSKRLTQIDMLELVGDGMSTPSANGESSSLQPRSGAMKKIHFLPSSTHRLSKKPKKITEASIQSRSPWQKYSRVYEIQIAGTVDVAITKNPPLELVHIKTFSANVAEETLHLYRQFQHQNIVSAIEAFTTEEHFYMVLEYMPRSLESIVRSPAYPNEQQLTAILVQVVSGLAYIAREGFEHGSLVCKSVLLSNDGTVKIANQQLCKKIAQSSKGLEDVRALGIITMQLMQKYPKSNGVVGVDNLQLWATDSAAVGFLSATTAVGSVEELLMHPLLNRTYQKEWLLGLISLAQISAREDYRI